MSAATKPVESTVRFVAVGHDELLSSKLGTNELVKARFGPRLETFSVQKSLNGFEMFPLRAENAGAGREFFIDNPLVRIHLIIEMILVDRPCAVGV